MVNEITIVRGDTPSIQVTVTDEDGDIFDLTNYTARLTVKENRQHKDADAIIGPITGTITTPSNGIIVFNLSTSVTDKAAGKYSYDVQINDSTTDVQTVILPADFTILQDVTRATS